MHLRCLAFGYYYYFLTEYGGVSLGVSSIYVLRHKFLSLRYLSV